MVAKWSMYRKNAGPAIRSWSYCGRSLVHAQECSSWGERSSKGEEGLRKCKVIQVFGFLTIQNNKVYYRTIKIYV